MAALISLVVWRYVHKVLHIMMEVAYGVNKHRAKLVIPAIPTRRNPPQLNLFPHHFTGTHERT